VRILMLNQYGREDGAPTSRLLNDAATALEDMGHHVDVVTSGARKYQGSGGPNAGSHGWRRWVRDGGEWLAMAGRACMGVRPDLVISLTSPPLACVAGHWAARRWSCRHVHWVLDLYPDLAVALGEVRTGRLERMLGNLSRTAMRSAEVLACCEGMASRLAAHSGVKGNVVMPWPPRVRRHGDQAPEGRAVWLYSGNLGRAHDWDTLLEAQAELEKDAGEDGPTLVFQGGGAGTAMAQARAESLGLRRISWLPYAEDDDLLGSLLSARILVATQRMCTEGMLWPSKLALAQLLPRPVLFVGPPSSCPARPGDAVFAPGCVRAVAEWVREAMARPVPASPPDLGEQISAFSIQAARRFAEVITTGSQRRR
jgi:hypothetical protein